MDTKKLRQKILDLAIRGKLVPQDPNDEPASVLLERIQAEKERLIKEGKIKRSKKSASDTPRYENVPFEVPESWEWLNVESFTYDLQYGTSEKSSNEGDVPVLRMGNISRIGTIDFTDLVYSSNKDDISKYALLKDDILFNRTNSSEWVGKTAIFKSDLPAIYAGYLIRVRCILVCPDYINFVLNSSYHRDWCNSVKTDAVNQSNINAQKLSKHLIPIPPYEEQLRIVAETKIWMNVIDKLDCDVSEFEQLISKIKSKILDLAIHGKLVPQDPNDEPAIELLKRINPKHTPCDNAHYENLPDSWCWTTLGEVCELITGSTPSKLHPEYYGGDFPFYKPTDLDAGRYVTIPSEFLTEEGKKVSRVIPVGATAICCIGSIGKCGYIEKEGATNQQINTAVPSKSLHPLYLYYFCNSTFFVEELTADSSAITISIVNKSKLSKMLISIPPYKEQLRIVARIEKLFAVLDNISAEL